MTSYLSTEKGPKKQEHHRMTRAECRNGGEGVDERLNGGRERGGAYLDGIPGSIWFEVDGLA
jgi:hypothetical protein